MTVAKKEQQQQIMFAKQGSPKQVWLELECLEVDPRLQRKLRMHWVREHKANLDPDKFGVLIVSLRGGHYYIVDGQHRRELLRDWDAKQKVPCLLYEGLTVAEEARLFLGLGDRRQARLLDLFHISVVSGDPADTDIERIVKAAGLLVSDSKSERCVMAVAALRRVYTGAGLIKTSSPATLAKVLRILKDAWGTDNSSFEGALIHGVGLFVLGYEKRFDEQGLIDKMAKRGASWVIAHARMAMEIKRRPLAECVASVLVDLYNVRKSAECRLEDWWAR